MRLLPWIIAVCLVAPQITLAQHGSNNTAAFAGLGAGAALGNGGGAGGTSASSLGSSSSGGGNAPIEIQIMSYQGLSKIAAEIANVTKNELCPGLPIEKCDGYAVLLEDPTSATQIGLYQSVQGYYDQLRDLHDILQPTFSLLAAPLSLTLSASSTAHDRSVKLTNVGKKSISPIIVSVSGQDSDAFHASLEDCGPLQTHEYCTLIIDVVARNRTLQSKTYTAQLNLGVRPSEITQIIQVSATLPAAAPQPPASKTQNETENRAPEFGVRAQVEAPALAGKSPAESTGGSGATTPPVTPPWITNMGALATALGGLKSGMTYSSSSAQPTTQSFEILVESELKNLHIKSWTSTSVLDLTKAREFVTELFGKMLADSSDLSNWSNRCTQTNTDPTHAPSKGTPSNPQCTDPQLVMNLAIGQQLVAAYTALIETASDSNGNLTLIDVLRGRILSERLSDRTPSLQLAVVAAAGSTRTNAYFLENLFYVPAPSYNAGVIATYELRGNLKGTSDELLSAGARTVFYDYNKTWMGTDFRPDELDKGAAGCGNASFCAVGGIR